MAQCLEFPEGFYCKTASTNYTDCPAGPCEAGFYCTGGSMLPNPMGGAVGNICPQGHFCPAGSSSPSPCPPGLCYAGYFCDAGSTQPDHKQCPLAPTESPVPFSPGHFNSDSGKWQSRDCQLCPAGYFCSGSGAHTPELCPAGYFCLPDTNFSAQHPCPKGTFGPRAGATGSSVCEPCPAGMYCSAPGLSQPSGFCYSGYHCASGATSPAPFKHRVSECWAAAQ
nr:scavenger receptor class F member 1-like [Anas platyrhynchos]